MACTDIRYSNFLSAILQEKGGIPEILLTGCAVFGVFFIAAPESIFGPKVVHKTQLFQLAQFMER